MSVRELNRNQLTVLKQNYIDECNTKQGIGTSWSELAMADSIVSDEEIFEAYAGYFFSEDDF